MSRKTVVYLIAVVGALTIAILGDIAFDWSNQWRMVEHRERIEALERENDKLRLDLKASDEAIDVVWQAINDMDNQVTRCILECGGPEE